MSQKLLVGLVLVVVVVAQRTDAIRNPAQEIQQPSATNAKEPIIPEHIFYGEVLTLLAKLGNVRDYQAHAALTDEEAEFLKTTAEECADEVSKQDAIAQDVIISLHRRRNNSRPSRRAPPVPPEIVNLQAQRDAIILRYRNLIRQRLGDVKFQQFSLAAKSIVQMRVSSVR